MATNAGTHDSDVPRGGADRQPDASGIQGAKTDSSGSGSSSSAQDFVAADTGNRAPVGAVGTILLCIAFAWSAFQLYVASAMPFWLSQATGLNLVLNGTEIRIIHLAFAIGLASLSYPLFKGSPTDRVPLYDWILAALGVGACLYLLVFKGMIADRAGLPTTGDLLASTIGMALLAIAVYRSLGLPMLVVAGVFVLYTFFGHSESLPG